MIDIPHRLYLAGPMSGYPECNFPLFHRVAKLFRDRGHRVFNPAENKDGGMRRSRAFYMRLDLPVLMASDGVVVLPEWEGSRGASLEVWIAIDLDIPVYQCIVADGTFTFERIEGLEPSFLPFRPNQPKD